MTGNLIPALLQQAITHYQSGQLVPAEDLCQQVLKMAPEDEGALNFLGIIFYQTGRNEQAISLLRKAVSVSPANSGMHLNLGVVLKAQGQLDAAVISFHHALEITPDYVDAYANLGAIFALQAKWSDAEINYRRALALKPDYVAALTNLGAIFATQGRWIEAETSYRQAIALKPDHAEAYCNLAASLQAQMRLSEAAVGYQQALIFKPDYVEAHAGLGSTFHLQGRLDEAEVSYRQAIMLKPHHIDVLSNLSLILHAQGRLEEAAATYRQLLMFKPDHAEAHCSLGSVLNSQGKQQEALLSYQQALALEPNYAQAHNNLGNVFQAQGCLNEAIASYRQALVFQPDYAEACSNLGVALHAQDKVVEAIASYQRALTIKPDYVQAYTNLGIAFFSQGQLDEAAKNYRKALALKPDHTVAHSNLLMVMLYMSNYSPADIFAEYQRFAERFETPLKAQWLAHENKRDVNKRLKIGYVSADFRTHAVAFFIEPILAHHTKTQVEVFAYHSNSMHDQMSDRLQALVDHWVPCIGLSEEQLAERIRADGIDILVDLSGHTGGNRLLAFARKPAPVQVTWIGFLSTTGLSAMDYRLTDDALDPVGMTEAFHSEVLVRLPSSATFTPSPDSPPVNNLPALSGAPFTFACLNNLAKINQPVIRLWSRILSALPDAKLMLGNAAEHETQQHLIRMFMQEGIAVERLILQPKMPLKDFLILHQQIDLALDPFPYGGGTTSNHSLWMGVPVITLAGRNAVARHGVAILKSAGLSEFITHSEEEYVELALKLANDLPRLNQIRQTLRERILAQPERDPEQLTQSLEAAYRTMWEKWCNT
jgi:predicted O-linked N-acetylglucosamine transferase (SPINDLY family)